MSNKAEKVENVSAENTEEVVTSGVGTYTFKNPVMINGEETSEIKYDLTELTGKVVRRAKSELQKRGYTVALKELDECFHAALFAEACGLSVDDVENFPANDYMNIADLVRDFLNGEE